MAGSPIAVARGASVSRDFVAADYQGNPVASAFLATDQLVGTIWPGGSSSALAVAPSCSWIDASAGSWRLQLADADTAALEPGRYRIQVVVRRGASSATLHDSTLDVTPSASPATDAPTVAPYCGYDDVLESAPWVRNVQDAQVDQARFLAQRIRARKWLDAIVAANYRAGGQGIYGDHSLAALAFGCGGPRRLLGPSPVVLGWLADDKLIVTPQVVQATTYKTVELIARTQVGINPQHAARSGWYRSLADEELLALTAGIDLDADGVADVYIPLSATNTLFT